MAAPAVDMGIVSFGYAFGEDRDVAGTAAEYVDDAERVLKWGCHTYHRAPEGVHATDLAGAAARQAMERAGVLPDELNLVVLANSEMPEYGHWDGAAALARELKCERTQTLLLQEGCGAGVTGLFYVASTMALQPEVETAVFVAVNRVSEFHRNRLALAAAVPPFATVWFDRSAQRRGLRDGGWRLLPGGDRPSSPAERVQAWLLARPALALTLGAVAVVSFTGVALVVGPPVPTRG